MQMVFDQLFKAFRWSTKRPCCMKPWTRCMFLGCYWKHGWLERRRSSLFSGVFWEDSRHTNHQNQHFQQNTFLCSLHGIGSKLPWCPNYWDWELCLQICLIFKRAIPNLSHSNSPFTQRGWIAGVLWTLANCAFRGIEGAAGAALEHVETKRKVDGLTVPLILQEFTGKKNDLTWH